MSTLPPPNPGPHPGRPATPPPGSAPPPPPPPPAAPDAAAGGPTGGGRRSPVAVVVAILGAIAIIAAATVAIVALTRDEAEAGEVFLEPAAEPGVDPFATGVQGTPVTVSTTTTTPATTVAPGATTSRSGATPGLYGGSRNDAVCDPDQQAAFLEANPAIARAFVDALNADPTLRWSGGTRLDTTQIRAWLDELTPVSLTTDTRVTNHGYRDGRPTSRQAILQAGTPVLVDAYGVPRVKCNCGNPLTKPTPVSRTPRYTGPTWPGFSPAGVVVITEVDVAIDVYVLTDTNGGGTFERPTGTTGTDDGPLVPPGGEPPDTTQPTVTAPPTVTEPPPPTGDFCAAMQDLMAYVEANSGSEDPAAVRGLVDLFGRATAVAPPEVRADMELLNGAVQQALASGTVEDIPDDPAYDAAGERIEAWVSANCGFSLDGG